MMESATSSLWMIVAAAAALSLSGLASCAAGPRSVTGQKVTIIVVVMGSVLGLGGVILGLVEPSPPEVHWSWLLPWGQFAIRLDPISALFLVPVFLVPALGSIYGLGYWRQSDNSESGRWLAFFYGLLAGSMALVAVAADGVLFLFAWEVMATAAYFACTAQEDNAAVRRAGWVYLVATHVGTLCLIAMFALWRQATGSFALAPAVAVPADLAAAIFMLAIVGFGLKAGLVPLHVWLPGAHANAPSHVSAVMSGVMLKMGIYGMVRMTALLGPAPPWWGGTLLTAGAITGVLGIAFAVAQRDLKRLLAYSSIENVGIITMGLGLALLGRSLDRSDWVLLGIGGALLHVWNHSLFKSLLFLGSGAILHAAGTREIDRLGGLARRMPRTMVAFLVGAVAICGLPPLNGFASEWLLYVGLFRTTAGVAEAHTLPIAAVAVVPLSMIGALAVACFVKLVGALFLGSPRSPASEQAHDPAATMATPMAVLGVCCIVIGIFPMGVSPLLERAAREWMGRPELRMGSLVELAPLEWLTGVSFLLLAALATILAALRLLSRGALAPAAGTWDCGYARPSARMQYTGSSFAQTLVQLFTFALLPRIHRPALRGPFPKSARFSSVIPDPVLDRLIVPTFRRSGQFLPRLRVLQQGQTQWYVLYVLVTMIVLLVWSSGGIRP